MAMRQAHGVTRARKLNAVDTPETQTVLVLDGYGEVVLTLSSCSHPVGLSPDEADFLAEQLAAASTRIRNAGKEPS